MTSMTYLLFDVFGTGSCQTDKELKARLRAARSWGYYAKASLTQVEELIFYLLENEAKVSAAAQAMMATRKWEWFRYRLCSQDIPNESRSTSYDILWADRGYITFANQWAGFKLQR